MHRLHLILARLCVHMHVASCRAWGWRMNIARTPKYPPPCLASFWLPPQRFAPEYLQSKCRIITLVHYSTCGYFTYLHNLIRLPHDLGIAFIDCMNNTTLDKLQHNIYLMSTWTFVWQLPTLMKIFITVPDASVGTAFGREFHILIGSFFQCKVMCSINNR